MITTFFFIIISIVYNIIISHVYFNKTHIKSYEIKIFGYLLITNLIGLFLELYNRFSITYLGIDNIFTLITCKIYLFYYIVYIVLFFKYFLAISFSNKDYKKYSIFFNIFSVITLIASIYIIYNLPLQINTDIGIYLSGLAVETVFSIMSIYLILIILIYIFRYKHIDKNKYIACLSFIIFSGIFGFIQKYFPFITLSTSMQTVVLYIMYNTIENPDAKMLQQVKLAKLLIENTNKNKNDLINNVSQEIRNPLNSIIGFSEDIKKYSSKLPKEVNEDLEYIYESSNNILEVIDGLTDIKEPKISDVELTLKSYSLKKEISRIKNNFNSLLDDKIKFIVTIDENIPDKLIGDKSYINEVINNLLEMSLNNTNSGEIELYIKGEIKGSNCNLLFIIKDTGKGYKKEYLDELKNIGIDDNIKVDEKNILFAISKNLVNIMNGKLEIESKNKEGSMYTVIIPQKIENKKILDDTIIITNDLSSKSILVVDDNELNIKVLKRALDELKIKIDSSLSGEDALNKVKSNNYDLILMDIMMPKLSGTETLKRLKKIEGFNTPVVALTADAVSTARDKYLKQGFVDYLSKPFTKEKIKEKISVLLR